MRLDKGNLERINISTPVPVDHTKDYARVLRMLDVHAADTIQLSEMDVVRYVHDDWDWQLEFANTASYDGSILAEEKFGAEALRY